MNKRLQHIELGSSCVGLDRVVQLCRFTHSLKLSPPLFQSSLEPFPVQSVCLCNLWNLKCSKKHNHYLSGIQYLYSATRNKDYPFGVACAQILGSNHHLNLEPKLVHLRLTSYGGRIGGDVTPFLTSLLDLRTVERLQIESNTRQKIQLSPFCEAFKQKSQLERLELKGFDFRRIDGRSLPEWFLETVKDSLNHKLIFLLIGSESTYHFVNRGEDGLFSQGRPYLINPEAKEIQYNLLLNTFGRGKLRGCNATSKMLVECLVAVKSASIDPLIQQVNHLCDLKDGPAKTVTTSLLYAILRESPHLLLPSTTGRMTSPHHRKKRKLALLESAASG